MKIKFIKSKFINCDTFGKRTPVTYPLATQPFNFEHDFQYLPFNAFVCFFHWEHFLCCLSFCLASQAKKKAKNFNHQKLRQEDVCLFIFPVLLASSFACEIYSITMPTNYKTFPFCLLRQGETEIFVDLLREICEQAKIANTKGI